MELGHGFEDLLLEVVIYLLSAAAIFIFIQLLAYTTITLRNHKRRRSIERILPSWKRTLESHISGSGAKKINLDDGQMEGFRDMLVDYYGGNPIEVPEKELGVSRILNSAQRRRIRILYREKGFLEEDLRQIRKGAWWSKITALSRLSTMELNDAEDLAIELMESGNREVIKSCVFYLSSISSRYLPEVIGKAYEKVDDEGSEELNVTLAGASKSADDLAAMADSETDRTRLAAAKILGQKGLPKATTLLKKLIIDPDEEIRREAIRSLGKVGTMKAVWALEIALEDSDTEIKSMAKREIKRIRDTIQVMSIWDMEIDDRESGDLMSKFSGESVMDDQGISVMRI